MLLLETGPTSGVWFDGPTTNGQGTGSLQADSQKSGLHGFRLSPERQLKLRDSPHATVHPELVEGPLWYATAILDGWFDGLTTHRQWGHHDLAENMGYAASGRQEIWVERIPVFAVKTVACVPNRFPFGTV